MAEFLCRLDPQRDLFLAAYEDDDAVASVVSRRQRRRPDGRASALVHRRRTGCRARASASGFSATRCSFAIESGYGRVWLTTFAGLDAARALYERHGFVLTAERDVDQWSGGVREQVFERRVVARAPA